MRRFLLSLFLIVSALSAFSADFLEPKQSKTFDISFEKKGHIEYDFKSAEPYISFPSAPIDLNASDKKVSTSFEFYYENTYGNGKPLRIIFDADDTYDYNPSDTGYMLLSEEGNGLNYSVSFSSVSGEAVDSITVTDSAAEREEKDRSREIMPGEYTVTMTLDAPAATNRYLAGLYEGYIILVYEEIL